jgi:N-succinyldiaminopimelate aminotransferase
VDALRAAVTDTTTTMLINSSHNPTGAVLNRDELTAIAKVAIEHDLAVITDEVYEHLLFDDREHIPLCTLPGMFERTVSISSAGKMFSLTGWKVGWVTAPPDLVQTVMSAKQWLTFTNAAPLQPAIAHALDRETGFFDTLTKELQGKRDLLCAGLAELDMDVYLPEATYFVTSDVRRYGYRDGLEFCLALPDRAGVVAIPSQGFYDDQDEGRHKVRWAFCKETASLEESLRRLKAADLRAG